MNKTLILVSLLGATLLGSPLAPAQAKEARASAEVRKEYDQFMVDFRAALKANDAAAVKKLTQFPFFWNDLRDAVSFEKGVYPKLFTAKVKRCLASSKPVYDRDPTGTENFTHFCGEQRFQFSKTKDGFRFAEVGFND